jgi:cytochrome c oxidase assembly protein subunit 15
MRRLAFGVAALLVLQCCLGLINVIAYLPLVNAVAHNFVAANLLMLLVVFTYQIYRRRDYSTASQQHTRLKANTNSIPAKV